MEYDPEIFHGEKLCLDVAAVNRAVHVLFPIKISNVFMS